MRNPFRFLVATNGKRKQDEVITSADRVRWAHEHARALEQKSREEEASDPAPERVRPLPKTPERPPAVPAVEQPPTPRPEHGEDPSEKSNTTDVEMMATTDREDLKAFIGPNVEKFLSVWDKMRVKKSKAAASWCWPAFLFTFAWFFYRKMYLTGAGFLLFPIIFDLIFPDSDAGIAIFFIAAGSAKSWYLQLATKKIQKISQRTSSNVTKRQQLQTAGGVSVAGGIIGGAIYAASAVFLILAGQLEELT